MVLKVSAILPYQPSRRRRIPEHNLKQSTRLLALIISAAFGTNILVFALTGYSIY